MNFNQFSNELTNHIQEALTLRVNDPSIALSLQNGGNPFSGKSIAMFEGQTKPVKVAFDSLQLAKPDIVFPRADGTTGNMRLYTVQGSIEIDGQVHSITFGLDTALDLVNLAGSNVIQPNAVHQLEVYALNSKKSVFSVRIPESTKQALKAAGHKLSTLMSQSELGQIPANKVVSEPQNATSGIPTGL